MHSGVFSQYHGTMEHGISKDFSGWMDGGIGLEQV
jgi:hypothetical protein